MLVSLDHDHADVLVDPQGIGFAGAAVAHCAKVAA